MARAEQNREDLLAEATALVERAELMTPELAEPLVVGFRADGCASFYFGQDSAWHFNTQGELRRAYFSGLLYKAEGGRLVSLERRRTATEVQLVRNELNAEQQAQILQQLTERLASLRSRLQAGDVCVIRCVPAESPLVDRVLRWLLAMPQPLRVASSPHAH